jgi:hypothetical protein
MELKFGMPKEIIYGNLKEPNKTTIAPWKTCEIVFPLKIYGLKNLNGNTISPPTFFLHLVHFTNNLWFDTS